MKITGLTELQGKLRQLSDNAAALDGQHNVSFAELFNGTFMKKNTRYSSMGELFSDGGFKIENQQDFEAISEATLDAHIAKNTQFKNWGEMKSAAGTQWMKRKLGF
jgi:hypothetical protein